MTTETETRKQVSRAAGPRPLGRVLVRVAVLTLLVGLAAAALGALVAGSAAAYGALVGALLAVSVFSLGTFVVNAVARVMPAAALMVALLTYTLQIAVMALVLVALTNSALLGPTLDRTWLGGTVIAGTVVWLGAQLWITTHMRIPVYDLEQQGGEG